MEEKCRQLPRMPIISSSIDSINFYSCLESNAVGVNQEEHHVPLWRGPGYISGFYLDGQSYCLNTNWTHMQTHSYWKPCHHLVEIGSHPPLTINLLVLCKPSKPVNSMPWECCCRPHMGYCLARRPPFSEGLLFLSTTKPGTQKYMKYIREHVASDTAIRGSRPTFLIPTRATASLTYHCRSCLWCLV